MNVIDLKTAVSASSYPGRGIIIGANEDGRAVVAYFIMGRSENSRNRIFMPHGDELRTEAFDPTLMKDPSLIIYNPVRCLGDHTIVTNGDQSDTIYDHMVSGGSFETALSTRSFEPDAPNYTPRISGMVTRAGGKLAYRLSILKSDAGDPKAPQRFFYEYTPRAGVGHFIHTYRCDGNPIPSFEGEPEKVALSGDIDTLTENVWNSLNPDNKVSLFVRYVNVKTGEAQTRIVNKNV